MHKVIFKQENGEDVTIFAACNENLLDLARKANIYIDAPCSGNGTCGKCLVKIRQGDGPPVFAALACVFACQTTVNADIEVFVPDTMHSYINKITQEVYYTFESFTLTDEYKEYFINQNFTPSFGLAVDIGTTTVTALLVEIGATGTQLVKATSGNAQIRYGADIIHRIIEQQKPGGIKALQDAIVQDTLIPLIESLCTSAGVSQDNITRLTVAANTTMNHLLLGVDANSIRIEPYEPAFLRFPIYDPTTIGIRLAQNAEMLIAPNAGSYVGGDITAGILGTGAPTGWQLWPGYGELSRTIIDPETGDEVDAPNYNTMLIDLGTNGEIVFSNREFMMACACSAGPAFEGGDISCGMRAAPGAIEAFRINTETMKPELTVIGGGKPIGLCGSGLIDVVAVLFRTGVIDAKGKVMTRGQSPCHGYVVACAEDTATGNDITLTETDIDNFIRAKGAIFSGIISLLSPLDFTVDDIDNIYLAGGIGSSINIKNAISVGMLPNLPEEKYIYLGNTAIDGAYSMLLPLYSEQSLEEVNDIADNITYIDLSSQPEYMDEFIAACFLPHTNENYFRNMMHAFLPHTNEKLFPKHDSESEI